MIEQASHQVSTSETAVVVGAGLAGLLAAAALSDFFKNVVVVERDKLPTRPGLRKGVPQGAHVHTLLGYAVEAFDQLIPGMIGRLYEAGNPMYGQGISLAAGQALALRAALRQSAPSGGDPLRGLALAYFAECFELNAQAWSVMETRDLAFPSAQGPRPADFDERWRVSHAIRRLAEVDPDVHRLSVRVLHLMEPTRVLQDPKIMQWAMALAGKI